MNIKLATIVGLRFVTVLLGAQGMSREADVLRKVLDAAQAGANVDQYLKEVADLLEQGEEAEWDELMTRTEVAVQDFLART